MAAISAVFYRDGKIRFTNVHWMIWDLFYPLGYLLVFGLAMRHAFAAPILGEGTDYAAFFLAGVLTMASFSVAGNTAWGLFDDRNNGIFYEMLTYPMSRAEFLLGKVLFNMFLAALQATLTVCLATLVLQVPIRVAWLPLVLVGVAGGTAGWFFFFAAFALKIRRNDVYNSVLSFCYFLFLFFSSTFYPIDRLPGWFRAAALASPVTWQADVLRYCSVGIGVPRRVLLEAAALLGLSVVSFLYAVRCLGRQE